MEKENVINDEERKKRLARKIWDIPFATANLHKLTKDELLLLIETMIVEYSFKKIEWQELDIKDILMEEKCLLIECLDSEFFSKFRVKGE